MSSNSPSFYDFDGLRFDPENAVLIRLSDKEKVTLRSKENLLLLALVKMPNQTVTYQELQQAVWNETSDAQMILRRLQVTKDTLQKKINNLRQIGGIGEVIKSVPMEGYIFTFTVVQSEIESLNDLKSQTELPVAEINAPSEIEASALRFIPEKDESKETRITPKTWKRAFAPVLIGIILTALFSACFFIYFSPDDEEEIRRVVKDSQLFESLVLYQNPTSFDENKLKEYWIVEPHKTDLDAARIEKGARNLREKGTRYGRETKCERFDFVSAEINENGDYAVVKTIESWFVAIYRNDGTLVENKTIGPYAVTYNLRKSDGKWLIEKSSTARVSGG